MGDRFNRRFKYYPDGTLAQIMVASGCCFAADEADKRSAPRPRVASLMKRIEETEAASAALGDRWEAAQQESERRSRSRARQRVFDLCYCNEFDWFITLTIDPAKCDSFDYNALIRKLNVWLDNRVRRRGLRYVVVPEYHKSGRIHFHGLINDVLPAVNSGHKDKGGHEVYNLPDWTLGFTTAIRLYGDTAGAVRYVTKYIGKTEHIVGGRWYLHGGDLKEPHYTYDWCDYNEFVAGGVYEYIPEAGYRFKICTYV